MGFSTLPHEMLHASRFLGTSVAPIVRKELAAASGEKSNLKRSHDALRQNLLRSLFHELGGRANGVTGIQIEEHGHAGKLIDVVDRLRADDRMPARDRVQRNHALTVVALYVELAQVFR